MRLLLVNQSIGPLFMGVVSAARSRAAVTLLYGRSTVPLPPDVESLSGLAYQRQSAGQRLATWLGFSLQFGWHLLRHGRRYQRLLVVSNPPLAPLLAPLAGRSYSLLLYDLYPQVLQQLSPGCPSPWPLLLLSRGWHRLNRVVFRRAERIYTLSEGMAAALAPAFPTRADWQARVRVIPPWADTTQLRPLPAAENPFRSEQHLDGRFLLLYSGNLGLTHPLEPLLQASALLARSWPEFLLLLIGQGPKRPRLEEQSQALKLANVRFLDPLPFSQVSCSYSAADLAVVCLDGPAAQASLPSKTFTALATGTPILALAPEGSDLAALIREHRCGWVIPPETDAPRQVTQLLLSLAATPQALSQAAANALATSRNYTPRNAEMLIDDWLCP